MICTYCKKQIEVEKKALIKRLFELETKECAMDEGICEEAETEKILKGGDKVIWLKQ